MLKGSYSLYLDTNIWIDYLWFKKVALDTKFIRDTRKRQLSVELITFLSEKNYRVVTSLFHNTEISTWFRDWLLFKQALSKGFHFGDFQRYKRSFKLSEKEREEVSSYYSWISDLPFVDSVQLKNLNEKALDAFFILTTDYGVWYMDALHLIVAMIEGCRYLITGDLDFKDKANQFLKDEGLIQNIKILSTKEFLNIIAKSRSRKSKDVKVAPK